MSKRVSIVGCGWLGEPLALSLLAEGYHVLGSKRETAELAALQAQGVEVYQLELSPQPSSNDLDALLNCDVLIINVPPGRKHNTAEFHVAQISNLLEAAKRSQVAKVLFISSTSVYGSQQGAVDETSPTEPSTESGRALKQIEEQILSDKAFQATVLRFSGLVGGSRKPGRFLAGKQVSGADSPINILHRDDCIGLIKALLKRDVWGEVFNASSDQHPSKRKFYQQAAQLMGLDEPKFDQQAGPNKVIANNKIKQALGYQLIHPDPMHWLIHHSQQEV